MKSLFLSLVLVIGFAGALSAQDDAEKAYKLAARALSTFNLDPANNGAKLEEAKTEIDKAIQGEAVAAMAKTWITRGQVYNALCSKEVTQIYVNPEAQLSPAVEANAQAALDAFQKAPGLTDKKYEIKEAYQGMTETAQYFNAYGNAMLQKGEYAAAFPSLKAVFDINKKLETAGEKPVFANPEDGLNHEYVTAFCAYQADDMASAKAMFQELYEKDYKEAGVYSTYFSILTQEGNEAEAMKVMDKGKSYFPGNTELLFAEINFFLQNNRLDDLVDKLKLAIEKEPNNVSLYTTLGSVYDNLFQRELEAGNSAKADEYFNEAMNYFNQGLAKDPKYVDAIYSVGALYYNKAASITKELKALESDLSKAGIQKYNAKKEEMFGLFEKALPFFQKAESINPNDRNTLIALKEIYAKEDDLALSNEFKRRLEVLDGGGTNTESYFKN